MPSQGVSPEWSNPNRTKAARCLLFSFGSGKAANMGVISEQTRPLDGQ